MTRTTRQAPARKSRLALAAAILALSGTGAAFAGAAPTSDRVWVGPMPFVEGRTLRADYLPTLSDAAQWPTVLRQARVLKSYIMVLPSDPVPGKKGPEASNEALRRLVRFVRARRLKVAFEVGGIRMAPDTPNAQAGEATARAELRHLRRWLDAGGPIDYLTTDHAVMLTVGAPHVAPGEHPDRGMTLSQAIHELVDYFAIMHRAIPTARLGVIESLGFFQVKGANGKEYARTVPALPVWYFDAYLDQLVQAMRLRKLALDHFHIDFGYEGVLHDGGGHGPLDFGRILAVEACARSRGVKPGVIVNAFHDRSVATPRSEVANREAHDNTLRFVEGYRRAGGSAEHLVLQTWQPYPDRTGPEQKPGTVLNVARDVLRAEGTRAPGARPFRMGFTPFPYDLSLEALENTRRFVRENGDLVEHHIECVPWTEARDGSPFHKNLMADWEGRKRATPPGGKVYLALSPGRGDLARYWGMSENMPLPPAFAGKTFDDPLVVKAYVAFCRRAVEFFRPDYLALGIEVNEVLLAGRERWNAYVNLHRAVYRNLKRDHPKLAIFASFTLHTFLNQQGARRDEMLTAFEQIMPWNDVLAVSFYPFLHGGTTDIRGDLDWLFAHFDRFHKPYAVAETGEAADRLALAGSLQVINGTPAKQAAYYEALLIAAERHRFLFVVSSVPRDYDALWEKIKGNTIAVYAAWRDCGLLDAAGKPRPAYDLWRRWFSRPLARL